MHVAALTGTVTDDLKNHVSSVRFWPSAPKQKRHNFDDRPAPVMLAGPRNHSTYRAITYVTCLRDRARTGAAGRQLSEPPPPLRGHKLMA